jgi:hypothetical protein
MVLEESHTMKSFFNKVILIVTDGLRKEHCIAAHLVCQQVIRMYRRSGALHTALYLNQPRASCGGMAKVARYSPTTYLYQCP